MTYAVGNTITAADINSWLSTVNTLYGTGSGDRGYGQTSLQAAVSVGNTVTSAQWTALRSMIANIANHQGTSATNLVPSANLATGQTIYANVSGTAPHNYDIGTLVSTIDTNRLSVNDLSVTTGAYQQARAAAWSNSTTTYVQFTWASEDAARFFFNSGGQLRMTMQAQPGSAFANSATAQDTNWKNIFSGIGTYTISARSFTRSGTLGTIGNGGGGSQGFYGLNTTTSAQIFQGNNIGTSAYANNSVTMFGGVTGVAGVNGGNGTGLLFGIQLWDNHTGSSDVVSAGVMLNVDVAKPSTANLPAGIAAPTITTSSSWSGS